MERNLCNKCGMCCKEIPTDFSKRIIYRDGIQPLSSEFEKLLIPVEEKGYITICRCKFLENNLCTNPDKPQICSDFPYSPLAFLPENCGYTGEVFLKKEKLKQQIRKLKEEIMHYSALIDTVKDKNEQRQYQRIIDAHETFIKKYKVYGSGDW